MKNLLLISFLLLWAPFSWSAQAHCFNLMGDLFEAEQSSIIAHRNQKWADELAASKKDKLLIRGGQTGKEGVINVSPAKNAMLPILSAVVLSNKPVHIHNLPKIRDMQTMKIILSDLGVKISRKGEVTTFDASNLRTNRAICQQVSSMRASILLLGPLVSRFGAGEVALPGGCPIGSRPIDLHLQGLREMGALIDEGEDYVKGGTFRLKGRRIKLRFPSVGATQNLMMAAVLAKGKTTIVNAAKEPEIDDLAYFLNKMGAKISGIGTEQLVIQGVKELKEVSYQAIGDRIEAATYIIGALMTNSKIKVQGFNPEHIDSVLNTLQAMGAQMEIGKNYVHVFPSELKAATVTTGPHPDFPTDVQAQLMALMTQAQGTSAITEELFENRMMHVHQLQKMAAQIELDGNTATIEGPSKLWANEVQCTDLRAGAALVLSGLIATGESEISDVYHLDRGYSELEEKLGKIGFCIKRIKGQ